MNSINIKIMVNINIVIIFTITIINMITALLIILITKVFTKNSIKNTATTFITMLIMVLRVMMPSNRND